MAFAPFVPAIREPHEKTLLHAWHQLKEDLENYPISDGSKAQMMRQIRGALTPKGPFGIEFSQVEWDGR